MGTQVGEEFQRGGKTLLDFLTFCVMSVQLEPVFAFLVREYRQRPTREGALALYDAFCAASAPARLRHPHDLLPPRNTRFAREVDVFRPADPSGSPAKDTDPTAEAPIAPHLRVSPPKHLFDALIQAMERMSPDPIMGPGEAFDPMQSPAANLPGGRMTAGQRAFVEGVWQPRVRPELVRAGFWKIADIA